MFLLRLCTSHTLEGFGSKHLSSWLSYCITSECTPELTKHLQIHLGGKIKIIINKKKKKKKGKKKSQNRSCLAKTLSMPLAASVPTWARAYTHAVHSTCACRSVGQPSVLLSKWQLVKKQLPLCALLHTITQGKGWHKKWANTEEINLILPTVKPSKTQRWKKAISNHLTWLKNQMTAS